METGPLQYLWPSLAWQGPLALPVSLVDINWPLSKFLFPQPATTFNYRIVQVLLGLGTPPHSLAPTPKHVLFGTRIEPVIQLFFLVPGTIARINVPRRPFVAHRPFRQHAHIVDTRVRRSDSWVPSP